ncbi:serine/threonine-protein kinase [Umezawaea beigongshangensis]|uniref:serine/threonine-protein kinase n=1 Tax=Umezawaea beigongshangensis TaxID=2780383 RepID=UPI0018F15788|nr:serine/threonine-protein kinase [Umezawaea beigongshangensis]
MSSDGRLIADRYRFIDRIGSGAMGVVWRAQDERLGRIVAVKQLLLQPGLETTEQDEAIQRAMREGRIAAKLHHPNAIAVYDVVEENGAPCLVMEYLPSWSLADALADQGSLDPIEVARIGAQAASALSAAHAAGIVHRDVKPGNVLLAENGLVKITDFGISRASDDITVTKTGLIAGTPAYLAPEIARGQDPTPASDVFSLGSTLYAAMEGEPPFGLSENTLGVLHAVAAGRINPPEHDGPLADVLLRLLNYEPDDRPTMSQTRELLNAVARGRTPTLSGLRAAGTPGAAPTGATTVFDPDRTRVVGGGARTSPPRGPVRTSPPMAPVHPESNNRPLVIAAVVLVLLLALGGLLIALGAFDYEQKPKDEQQPDTGGGVTSSQTAAPTTSSRAAVAPPPEQPTTQEPTTEQETTTQVVEEKETTTTPPPTTTTQPPVTTSKPPVTTTQPPGTSTPSLSLPPGGGGGGGGEDE